MFCPNCGKQIKDTAKFCPKCGAKVAADPAATVKPQNTAGSAQTQQNTPARPVQTPQNTARPVPTPQNTPAKPAQPQQTEPPKKKGKAVPILIALLILVLAAGGGLIYYTSQKKNEAKQEESKKSDDGKENASDDTEADDAGGKNGTKDADTATAETPETEGESLEEPTLPSSNTGNTPATMAPVPAALPVSSNLLYSSQADFSGLSKIVVQKENVTQSSHVVQQGSNIDNTGWSAFDGRTTTSWQEGRQDDGIGEYVTARFDREYRVKTITLLLGNQRSDDWYVKNNRPQMLTLTLGGQSFQVTFPDEKSEFAVVFSEPVPAWDLTVTIDGVYSGSQYRDTVISEIGVYGN